MTEEPPEPTTFERWQALTLRQLEKPSFVEGMAADIYSAAPGVRSSVLKEQTPKEMRFEIEQNGESSETYATVLGTVLHKAILEPDIFEQVGGLESWFQYAPGKGLQTKEAKAARLACPGKPLVTPEIVEKARRMRDCILNVKDGHQWAQRLLGAKHRTELSGFAWDEESQIIKKARVDFLPIGEKANYLVDLKSTDDIREVKFWGQAKKLFYGMSAAYYQDVVKAIEGTKNVRPLYYLISVTGPKGENQRPTDGPYMARVFEISTGDGEPSLVDEGRTIYKERLAMLANAMRTNHFEGYEHEDPVYLKFERPFSK